jgi:Ca-activated chloride channel family protein
MESEDKLPLLKSGLELLAGDLRDEDSLAIVVYAGASGLALPATRGSDRTAIRSALRSLGAGGSTNGGAGIELAYRIAQQHFVTGGVNRVVLATDGDFNVGTTSHDDLMRLIEDKRKSGVFLTVLGFGTGNLKDSTMEGLADKGNGNYAYIDSITEAHKVLVREMSSTLVTVAKDVKLQIEWNPAQVASYRLIGYENRKLADRDFADDTKDAGEMGAGHTVTALYDVTLASAARTQRQESALRYQGDRAPTAAASSGELMTVKIRYKHPSDGHSALLAHTVTADTKPLVRASEDMRLAAAVAAFGMLLRKSEHAGNTTFSQVRQLAASTTQDTTHDARKERLELIELIDSAKRISLGG